MADVQRHRGPDDQGFSLFSLRSGRSVTSLSGSGSPSAAQWEGGLGFNRLSILDLSDHGHQPMLSADGSTLIAYNGEVYNAFDHRPALEAEGFRFRSNTDTEVLLYLYQRHGLEGMLERANGMFAFALVDLRKGELCLARDRLGIKPLYCWSNGQVLLFASEAKAFLSHPAFVPELNSRKLDEYFLFRYVAGGDGLLSGVRQLAPGHWLRVSPEGTTTGAYWTPPEAGCGASIDRNRAVDELDHHIRRSVRMRLLSDVKVGCQLSGGVDSSLITVLAARQSRDSLDGFSIIFDDERFSEERWIDEAASAAGVRCHKYELSAAEFCDDIEAATWHLDQPLSQPNSLGILNLARQARSHVAVFLSGEGADELFGGYTRFLYARLRPRMRRWAWLMRRLPHVGGRLGARFGGGASMGEAEWFMLQSAFMRPSDLHTLRPDGSVRNALAERRSLFDDSGPDRLAKHLNYEMSTYLVDLLLRQDKMTMAQSMENRVPYLDHELVEFVRSLPSSYLVTDRLLRLRPRMGNTKAILKKVAERYFGKGFVYRSKAGFSLPLRDFFRHSPFEEMMQDQLLPGMRQRGVINSRVVERWWQELLRGRQTDVEAMWICAAFELWAQLFLDRNRAGSAAGERLTLLRHETARAGLSGNLETADR